MAITASGVDVAGGQYTLTCTVTVPDGLLQLNTPTVEWVGNEGVMNVTEGTIEVSSSGVSLTTTLTFSPLQDSQDGRYTCRATFFCEHVTDMSVSDSDEWTLKVMGTYIFHQYRILPAPCRVTVTVSATGNPIYSTYNYCYT